MLCLLTSSYSVDADPAVNRKLSEKIEIAEKELETAAIWQMRRLQVCDDD